MSCPFLDPNMLSRIPPQKREEMMQMYHKMKKDESDHLKIDVKEDDIQNITTEQMMMGMTGTSSSSSQYSSIKQQDPSSACPMMHNQEDKESHKGDSSGGQEPMMDFQEQFQDDPQAFMERMAQMSEGGGSCPFMGSKYYDPLNQKMEFGWNCTYKSRWAFLLEHKGRFSSRRFAQERKLLSVIPQPFKHSLFHPDDLKKLRDKPFSGLYFHFDKSKEDANKLYKEEEYFEALDYYEQILSVFKWLEFTDKEKQEDFFKNLKLDPILDKDVKLCEKDLADDECEIELRSNLVVTLLLNIGYCYMKLFFFDEAMKCFNYAIELMPIASDAYLRRSQLIMCNQESTMEDLKKAVEDVNKALERRPKDKFFQSHKQQLMDVIQAKLNKKIQFIKELVDKAHYSLQIQEKVRRNRQRLLEENKETQVNPNHEQEEKEELEYPEECKVLDIMKEKYYDAVAFYYDTEDKKQMKLAVKEFQRFSFFYEKMSKYLEFDPQDIEEEVYTRLDEETKKALSSPIIVKEINKIRVKRAQRILEDEDVNILNFQMFQYALKILQKEKKKKMKEEEELKQKEEERLNGGKKKKSSGMAKLIFVNFLFFVVVVGGILFASGNYSILNMIGFNFMDGSDGSDNKTSKGGSEGGL